MICVWNLIRGSGTLKADRAGKYTFTNLSKKLEKESFDYYPYIVDNLLPVRCNDDCVVTVDTLMRWSPLQVNSSKVKKKGPVPVIIKILGISLAKLRFMGSRIQIRGCPKYLRGMDHFPQRHLCALLTKLH